MFHVYNLIFLHLYTGECVHPQILVSIYHHAGNPLYPFCPPLNPSPPGIMALVPWNYVFVSVWLFTFLFLCFLYSTWEWKYVVPVVLHLTYFTWQNTRHKWPYFIFFDEKSGCVVFYFIYRERYKIFIDYTLWHPTPVLLPGKSHGRRSLVGCSPWGG